MKTKALQRILSVEPYKPGKPIEEVRRELGIRQVIKLASNENPYGPSPKVVRAIAQAAKTVNRYPDGSCYYLRKALARRLKIPEDQLIFGNGSDEIIVLLVRALVEEGDEVVVARPSFLIYELASKLAGAVIRSVALKNFRYDLDGMLAAVSERTKIIFIGNPDNPAGTYIPADELEAFLSKISSEVVVIIDEAYFEYVRAKDYPGSLKLLERFSNLLVTRTFSKMYGLAGLRIGYGIARPELIDVLNRLREPFNVNSLAQVAAVACLDDRAYYRKIAVDIERQRKFFYRELKKLPIKFYESVTNFILIECRQGGQAVANQLMRRGVIVRDMGFWGLKNFIRVTLGTASENRKFITELKSVLSKSG